MNVAMFSDVEQINTMEVNEALLSILRRHRKKVPRKAKISSLVSASVCVVAKLR